MPMTSRWSGDRSKNIGGSASRAGDVANPWAAATPASACGAAAGTRTLAARAVAAPVHLLQQPTSRRRLAAVSKLRAEIKQQKPFGSVAEEVLLNLVRTASHLEARGADLLAAHDLTPAQYNVLRILRGAGPDGHPCQEIGARMISRVPDVTRLVDRLEAAGLVTRKRSDTDRRV